MALEIYFRVITPTYPEGTTYGSPISRNSDQFRDREYIIPKPDSVYRIMFLGDSFTWGVGMRIEETIPKLVESDLRSKVDSLEVINAAIPGYNSVQQLILLKEKGLEYQPDMVVLDYNLNDIQYLPELAEVTTAQPSDSTEVVPVLQVVKGRNDAAYFKTKGIRGFIWFLQDRSVFINFLVPRVGFIMRRLGLLNSLEFSWAERILQGFKDTNLGWLESKRALKEMEEICSERDIEFLIVVFPFLIRLDESRCREVYKTISKYGSSINVPLTGLWDVFDSQNARQYWLSYSDSHPNAEAHRIAADLISPFILKHVRVDSSNTSNID